MRELIESFESLLVSTVMHGGDAVEGAQSLLDRIDWKAKVKTGKGKTVQVVDHRLDEVCAQTGGYGSNAADICAGVQACADQIVWARTEGDYLLHADTEAFSQNFAYTAIIGPGCPLPAEGLYMGLSLQGPDLHYPMHAHQAEELYWIAGGDGDWKIGIDPWFAVAPGDVITHPSGIRHAMQTNRSPMLKVWAWWRHIDSPIVIVRA